MTNPAIKIDSVSPGRFSANPIDRLNGSFNAYLDACKRNGFRFDPASKTNIGPVDDVPALVAAFLAAGFKPKLTARAHALLTEAAATLKPRGAYVDDAIAASVARGTTPFPHQVIGIRYLAERSAALLTDDMGLGKTLQALLATEPGAPMLIVCPKSVRGSWVRETKAHRPDLTPVVLNHHSEFRFPKSGEAVILHYEALPHCEAKDGEKPKQPLPENVPARLTLVVDEIHYCKAYKAQRSKRVRALARAAKKVGGKRIGLSGTPMPNQPGELWTVLNTFDLGTAAWGSYDSFRDDFGGYEGRFGIVWGIPTPRAAEVLSTVALGRKKGDVLNLPPKIHTKLEVELSASCLAQLDKTAKILADLGYSIEDGKLVRTSDGTPVSLSDLMTS